MEALPLVTWVIMASAEFMPYFSRSSFDKVLVGLTKLRPPAWQAAQLALKTVAPLAASPAKAGAPNKNRQAARTSIVADSSFFKEVLLSLGS